jgi:hypothetical protein
MDEIREMHDVTETALWRRAVEEDNRFDSLEPLRLSARQLEAIFETTRTTLEEAGIPFLRANALAEKILTAVRLL